MKFKNVIVTGGSGFIGSHLVDALVPVAEKVFVIDKKRPKKSVKNKAAKYKIMDIREKKLDDVFASIKPDAVFHMAAHINDRESIEQPAMNADNNILGAIKVFKAAGASGARRVIFASSCAIYGRQHSSPISEECLHSAETPYGISKLAGEKYLDFFRREYGLSTVALRFGNVYGPRQDSSAESGVVGIFAARLLKGDQVFINNDGQTTRDYIFVLDVVDALLKAAGSSKTGIFNIGTGIETSTKKIFDLVSSEVGVEVTPEYREGISDLVKKMSLDATNAKTDFGWLPKVSLEEGIKQTVAWFRAEG